MIADFTPRATLAVSDVDRARGFYEGLLGLKVRREGPDGIVYDSGTGSVLVYASSFAGTNKATYVSFQVDEDAFDQEVDDLRAHGVEFQTFDLPGATWNNGVVSMGTARSAWFTDPDGNILNVQAGMV